MRLIFRVFAYLRRYPWFAAGTLSCAIASTLLGLLYPRLTQFVIDDVIAGGRAESLPWACLGLAGAFFGRDLFNAARILLNNSFEQRVIFDLRDDLYATLQRLPSGFFDNRASGDLMTRIGEDVTSVERVLIDGIEGGVVAALQVAVAAALLVRMNADLALWAMAPAPAVLAGVIWYTTTAHRRYAVQRRAVSALNSLLLDNLQGIRLIKAFVRQETERGRFREHCERVRESSLQIMRAWALYSPSMSFVASAGIALVLFVGGRMAIASELTTGQLVAFILLAGFLYEPLSRLHGLNQLLQAGRAAARRVFDILDEAPEPDTSLPGEIARLPGRAAGRIEFRGVRFEYRSDLPVLHGIDLAVEPGQTVALVGPTGAGKSTIAGLLLRFYPHQVGEILLDGIDTRRIPLADLRSQIGFVTQEPLLFNGTIRENLLFGKPGAGDPALWAALESANAAPFVRALPDGLGTLVGERGVKLSVGEKQRITIARALLKDPPILVLDEATASVDTATERLIQSALDRLTASRTCLVIAHRLSTVLKADQIVVLEGGRVAERGRHEDLIRLGGRYARLWSMQDASHTIEEQWA
ncbi:MAG: ABC transporter ATP-binding protein [Verrucomicrobiae bacterium]|nr:ABC transporter ATP-binding protein [Verrucomicrobiae bacterium]